MRLYLIRHAIAEDPRDGVSDHDRALTPKGRAKFGRALAGMKRLGVRADVVLHSPKRRTVETAEMFGPVARGRLVVSESLVREPGDELLVQLSNAATVACVGHQPHLTELAARLLFGTQGTGDEFELKKGGLMVLEGDPSYRGMTMLGMYTPRDLRLMGRTGRRL